MEHECGFYQTPAISMLSDNTVIGSFVHVMQVRS